MTFFTDPITLVSAAIAVICAGMLAYSHLSSRSGARALSTLQATQLINHNNALVIDLRSADEFSSGSITNARNFPLDSLATRGSELARFKSRPVILVCAAGQRSAKAVQQLMADGFTEVFNLGGGLGAWREAGLPVLKPAGKEKS